MDINSIRKGSKVITSENSKYLDDYVVLKLNKNMTTLQIKQKILALISNNGGDREIIIGVDPGMTTGVALLQDQEVLDSTIVLTADGLIRWIRGELEELNINHVIIKVGDGIEPISQRILKRLHREFENHADIYMVDERFTSIKSTNKTTIHEQAAIRIAKRNGIVYKS